MNQSRNEFLVEKNFYYLWSEIQDCILVIFLYDTYPSFSRCTKEILFDAENIKSTMKIKHTNRKHSNSFTTVNTLGACPCSIFLFCFVLLLVYIYLFFFKWKWYQATFSSQFCSLGNTNWASSQANKLSSVTWLLIDTLRLLDTLHHNFLYFYCLTLNCITIKNFILNSCDTFFFFFCTKFWQFLSMITSPSYLLLISLGRVLNELTNRKITFLEVLTPVV